MSAGLHLESAEEVNQLLREVCTYTIHGLTEPDIRCKQFYLERIWLSCGMSLAEIREKLGEVCGMIEGVNPE
jgi:hypothetical protein